MSDLSSHALSDKKQQRSTDLTLFFINLLVIYAVYSLLAIEHFSTDGYVLVEEYFSYLSPIVNGRAAWLGLLHILTLLGINVFRWQEVAVILFIIVLAWTALRVVQQVKSEYSLKEGLLFSLPILLGVVNVHIQEWFFFSDCTFFYAAGMLAAIEAAVSFRKRRYILCILLSSFAVLNYQVLISVFVIYALFFMFLHHEEHTFLDYIKLVCIGLSVGVVAVVAQKICLAVAGYQSLRTLELNLESILSKVQKIIIKMAHTLWDAQDILPRFILPATLFFALALVIFGVAVYHRNNQKAFGQKMLLLIFVGIISIGVIVGPLMIVSSSVWFAPRVLVGFFTLLSMLVLCAVVMNDGLRRKIMLALCAALLAINIYCIQGISIDTFKTNVLDEFMSNQVMEYLDQYEEETGIQISSVAFYYDEHVDQTYEEVDYSWYDTNIRLQTVDWIRSAVISYYADRRFSETGADPDVYEMYFAGKNWDAFMPEQQIVILDDVLHWCIY